MKIYLLSLPDDLQRRAALEARLPEHFPYFEIVPAIDGRYGMPAYDMPLCRRNRHRPLSPTEIACALGHLEIYRRIIDGPTTEDAFSLVLEDDVIGTSEDLRQAERLAAALPRKSLVLLGGQQGMPRAVHLYGHLTQWKDVYRIPSSQHRNLARTCCYLLDRDMAKHLLRQQLSCLDRADDWAPLLAQHRDVYLASILSHPLPDRLSSHIDESRADLHRAGILRRWRRDGWRESIARPATRILTPLLAPWFGLHRIY